MHRTDQNPQFRLGQRRQILLPMAGEERHGGPRQGRLVRQGVEDLKTALWYAKHAIDNNVPFLAVYLGPDNDIITARPIRLLGILEAENWADLEPFWNEIKWGCYKKAVKVLADKINEIEKEGK